MPLFLKEKIENSAILGIWQVTEDLNFFIKNTTLLDSEINYLERFSADYRKKEFVAVRKLLQTIYNKPIEIKYTQERKPYISNNVNISISHTKGFVTIILCESHEVGIDIEHISDRVIRIKNKFLEDYEQEWCKSTEQHIICWSAKESIFKLYGKNVNFKDIKILPFKICDSGIFNSILLTKEQKKYSINYRKVENNFLTFVFK